MNQTYQHKKTPIPSSKHVGIAKNLVILKLLLTHLMMDDIRLTLNASIVLSAHMHIVILLYLGYIPKLLIMKEMV